MNISTKKKINRMGLVGMIFSILLILSSALACAYYIGDIFRMTSQLSNPNLNIDFFPNSFAFYFSHACSILHNLGFIVSYCLLLRLANRVRLCDTPFEDEVVRRMTVFAWVLFGVSVFASCMGVATWFVFQQPANAFFSLLPSVYLVVSLIVLGLTKIFRYGAQLQKESDETL